MTSLPILDLSLKDDPHALKAWIKAQAMDLGFNDCRIAKPDTRDQLPYLEQYLAKGHQADMHYLAENLDKRADPTLLVEHTRTIICVRLDYLHEKPEPRHIPNEPKQGVIARYARGRDYHKVMRSRLKQLAQRIEAKIGAFHSRPFSDSAPIFEKALAENAGMGWTGKHTLLINQQAGSFFVLGELFTSLDLPLDQSVDAHCGTCTACIDICPTKAIIAPYQLDAGKCIAYLTIEYKGSIPHALRSAIGNRIFGCDDCQLICPWNRYASKTKIEDFYPRHGLDQSSLLDLWAWDESTFLMKTEGSPIRRTGYQSFKRNIAIGLGNTDFSVQVLEILENTDHSYFQHNDIVQEHTKWALNQHISGAQKII